MSIMQLEITEELIGRQSPEAQAIIRMLLAKIQELEERLNKSPRNSSLPPSTEHPHASRHGPSPPLSVNRGVNRAMPSKSVRSCPPKPATTWCR